MTIIEPGSTLEGKRLILTPSSVQSIGAGIGITAEMIQANALIRISGSSGVTVTATPSIAPGIKDGQIIILEGTSDTDTVTLQDESNLAGSHLSLAGGIDFTLAKNQTLELIYNSTYSRWCEITRSNNLFTAT